MAEDTPAGAVSKPRRRVNVWLILAAAALIGVAAGGGAALVHGGSAAQRPALAAVAPPRRRLPGPRESAARPTSASVTRTALRSRSGPCAAGS